MRNNIKTVSPIEASRQLLAGLASTQILEVDYLLTSDALMQIWLGDDHWTYQSRPRVCKALAFQKMKWPDKPFFNVQGWDNDDESVNVQFDIWDGPDGRMLHPNCSLSITLHHDKIKTIILHQSEPAKQNLGMSAD